MPVIFVIEKGTLRTSQIPYLISIPDAVSELLRPVDKVTVEKHN